MFTFKRLKRLNSLLLLVLAYCISMPGLLAAVAFYLLILMSFCFHGPNGHMQLKWCMASRQGNAHLIWSFVCCRIVRIWSYLYWSLKWTCSRQTLTNSTVQSANSNAEPIYLWVRSISYMQSLLCETVQLKCQKEKVVIRPKLEKEAIFI